MSAALLGGSFGELSVEAAGALGMAATMCMAAVMDTPDLKDSGGQLGSGTPQQVG